MSEEILKALTQLFAIISKQDDGVTEDERDFVIRFFQQELDHDSVKEYVEYFDQVSGYNQQGAEEDAKRLTSVKDSVRTLGICRKINKTLTQKQKVIVLIRLIEMINAEHALSGQAMEIINTVANVFNIGEHEYSLTAAFVAARESHTPPDLADLRMMDVRTHDEAHQNTANGYLLFMVVRSTATYFVKYVGHGANMLNGFHMQPNRVYLFSHGSTVRMASGDAVYYSDLVSYFNKDLQTIKLSFNANIEEFRFATGAVGLRHVEIAEGAGKLIGIMGASGAGKTTLLNVMAGLEKPGKGEILINGINIHTEKEKIQGVIGYVSQDDLLIEELTVYQNLYFNAKLCFAHFTEEEIQARVNEVLEDLGLDQRKNLRVGSALDKTISGGQRKRLNIALELIREPAVLFLDEPTSGLSSRDSENVIDLLKELSMKGKLIFVVIHQPSSDIYKMFDKMIIMDTGGYPAYYGIPVEAIKYFKKATHQVDANRGQCEVCANVNPEQIFNIMEAKVVDEYGQTTAKRKITPVQWHEMYSEKFTIDPVPNEQEAPPKSLSLPTKTRQTLIYAWRDFAAKISNKQYLLINLLEAPLLAIILAFITRYKSSPDGMEYQFRYNDNIPAFMLMSIVVALFMGLTVSAEEIIRDRKILKRESFLNLSWSSYIFSKLGILFLLSAIQMLLFVVISNLVLEIHGMTFMFWIILFSTACFANVLGLNISSAFNSAVTVYILIPLLLIPQMILSGLLFKFDKLNELISNKGKVPVVADLMASRWAYEAMAVHQFTRNGYEKYFYDEERERSQADVKSTFMAGELKNSNAFLLANFQNPNDSIQKLVAHHISILRSVLRNEPSYTASLPSIKTYNKVCGENLESFLDGYKYYYKNKFKEKDQLIEKKMAFYEQQGWNITANKNKHYNETLAELVRNITTKDRVLEYNSQLLQQVDPVFQSPDPAHFADYRAVFFAPEKNWLYLHIPTPVFNLLVIWSMSALLYYLLYKEAFRKAINLLSTIHKRKS
ncbi:MAG: ATP-binding cassette domain-containing protein [Cyclobacteriaceae bacterium]|nr:ATP-binding cassette domain-containing protein [Cyclobacteriaceae bacterium]